MAHHPTFRKIYCDAVPYLFKKVRHSPQALLILPIGPFQASRPRGFAFPPCFLPRPMG